MGKRGPQLQWHENMRARFPDGTFARIEAVLGEREDRTDFVRQAVELLLKQRKSANVKQSQRKAANHAVNIK